MFRICHKGTGFQITFSNGWTISVQFGSSNYCENKDMGNLDDMINGPQFDGSGGYECETAEIAVLNPDGNLIDPDEWGDTVKGWVDADEVGKYIVRLVDDFPGAKRITRGDLDHG